MGTTFVSLLQAAPSSTGSLLTTFIPFGLVILIFYFLIIRPQNKKQKDTERMLSALKKGDRIVTIGGVHGVIQAVKDTTVVVKVDETCKIEYSRSAIATIVSDVKVEPKVAKKIDKKADKKALADAAAAEEATAETPAAEADAAKAEEKK
ncbi:MAG: preprotein translocase subunit YajC [Treponema sp. GWB1_62_6]|nr:MAG: preprotein translocase subunit YajC [Treponema sp. GWC1_61_84]OHE65768.1 MAG: preprotein translocase subunit YajC [Treponema sp. GWA1_62_8]OHE68433.1 MAG: preprotein translocase subunit YajC [Treponema sp. RIFOXYC1_FULL_61_9]OHE70446.1 MAG: preprotein translocase subunit YajC [Treponema sp. GWB1_62_6]HCM27237.1 preprotein translocase subunit YajC [Treponema sp.]